MSNLEPTPTARPAPAARTKPAARKKTARTPPPICLVLKATSETLPSCIHALEAAFAAHPLAKVAIEALRIRNGFNVDCVVAIQPPRAARWDKPTASLVAASELLTHIVSNLHAFTPCFAPRPDEAERADAREFVQSYLSDELIARLAA